VADVLTAAGVAVPGADGGPATVHEPGWVAIEAGRVVETGAGRAADALDLGDVVLAPAFVDLQVNGVDDVDFASADADGWQRTGRRLLDHGVTSYCPTIVSAPLDAYGPVLERVAAARADAATNQLPEIVGAHLEGPFLGGAPGAHPRELLRDASAEWLAAQLDRRPGVVRIVTLAPEADPGYRSTRLLAERGVVVAVGHSTADYEEVVAAADAGARLVTHLFNGMGPMHHRAPGVAGAALDDDRLTPTVIADLVHVHPVMVRLAFTCKRDVVLVSDAVSTAGLDVSGGAAHLKDGTLAGAVVLLDTAVRNVVRVGVPLARAIEAASSIPGRVLGLETFGARGAGGRADLVALDATTLAPRGVWLDGVQRCGPAMPSATG